MSNQGKELFEFDGFRLDPGERLLLRDGEPVPLTPKAFDLLLVLVRNAGHLVAKDELMQAVWPDSFVEEGNLTFTVSAVRKALGGEEARRMIETVPKRGYRFAAGVRTVAAKAVAAEAASLDGPPVEAPRPRAKRTGGWVVASAAALAVALAAAALYPLARQTASGGESKAAPLELRVSRLTSGINVSKVAISPDGRYVGYVVREAAHQSLWIRQIATNSHVQLVPPAQVDYLEIAFSPDGSYLSYISGASADEPPAAYQVPVLGGPVRTLEGPLRPFRAISPDGRKVFSKRISPAGDLELAVSDTSGSDTRTLTSRPAQSGFFPAAWSPDGRLVACVVDVPTGDGLERSLLAVRVEDGAEEPVTSRRWKFLRDVVWLRDGDGLLVTAADFPFGPYQIYQVSYPSGEVRRITNDTNNYVNLSLAPDRDTLVAIKSDIDPIVWVVADGESARARQITFGPGTQNDYWGLSWAPGGRIVYESTAGGNQDIWVMEADGRGQRQLTAAQGTNFDPAVSPDGRFVAFVSDRTGHGKLWRMDADGGNPRQITFGASSDYLPCWTPDGRWLVYTSGEHWPHSLWKVPADGGTPVPVASGRSSSWPAVSPDGKLVACWSYDERARRIGLAVVPLDGGGAPRFFDTPPSANTWSEIRWSADGKALLYVDVPGGVGNIWSQPLDGGATVRVTDFSADRIFRFDVSRVDGALVCSRGDEANDVVLVGGLRDR